MVLNFIKTITFVLLGIPFFSSCENEVAGVSQNPYLQTTNFRIVIDTDLPLYSDLQTSGNAIYIPNVGIKGVLIVNSGSGFLAWEASCPNHKPSNCSATQITGGINTECACEGYVYNLITGSIISEEKPETPYALVFYPTYKSGNTVIISN